MAAAGEGDKGEKSGFRCLDAVRYVAATVVIVLIAAVVVNAIKVVARPDNIYVLVVGNSVITRRQTTTAPAGKVDGHLSFEFTLHTVNPSGRVRLYFYSIMVYIFENSTVASTPKPATDCSIFFSLGDITLKPMGYIDVNKVAKNIGDTDIISHSFFQALNKPGGRVSGATMRVDGSLVSETGFGRYNTSAQRIILYCRDVMVGPEDKVAMATQLATTCTTS